MADAKIEQDDMAAEWAAALEQQSTATASEDEIAASSTWSARSAATSWSTGTRSTTSAESLTAAIEPSATWAEALREFTGHRIEFTAADRIEALVHHASIEARHVAVNGHRLGRSFSREPWRQEQSR